MKPSFIDHIVIIVRDIKKTEKFYSSFLSKSEYTDRDQIVYRVGKTKLFFVLSSGKFKEVNKDLTGLNHLAFGVSSRKELEEYKEILDKNKIKNSGIKIDKYGKKDFIWFDDPDGYRIEFYLR